MKPLESRHGCHWRLARQCAKSGRLLFCLTAIGLILGSTLTANADRKSREEEKARQQRLERQLRDLEYILKHESDGTLSDRKDALKDMISTGVAPDEAYWQAGYIKQGDKWISVRDRWLTAEQEQNLKEYTKARSNSIDSDEGHYKLAQWCAENGFDAQAYAHLKTVLMNHPDNAGLRKLLGYQKIGDRWMNVEDYEEAVRDTDRLAKELQQWGTKVAEIRDGLHTSDPRDQNRAKAKLKQITEVAAVPALEMILLSSSDMAARACVDQLCQIKHRRSSIALCKAAMFLPESTEDAKQAAIEELKERPLEDFVPVLLGKMQTPIIARYWLFQRFTEQSELDNPLIGMVRTGRIQRASGHWIKRSVVNAGVHVENESQYEHRNYTLTLLRRDLRLHTFTPWKTGMAEVPFQANHEEKILQSIEQMLAINRTVENENQSQNEMNDRVLQLMGRVTEESQNQSPEYWWKWWADRIEVRAGQKLQREVQEIAQVEEGDIIIPSCFTAGTPVWTDRGPRPIEQLRVGDMALSKDVETGELSYRPIIRTTTRQPKPLVTIDLGVEQITSTGGHPFFVPGEGWVRARELQAGQFLHTPTGTIQIDNVTETPEDETYNLVVDGFHTYFVGMSQALVHDVSITSPTDAVVPGLLDR